MANLRAGKSNFCGRTRREFLWESGCGFGAAALSGMLAGDGFFNQRAEALEISGKGPSVNNPLAPKPPLLPGHAKSVIFLFMYGGPSHVDTFDYKPDMIGMDNKTVNVKTLGQIGRAHV